MQDESDDEFGQPAEEQHIFNGLQAAPLEEEGPADARIPRVFFPPSGDTERNLAEWLASMAGFKLTLGPRSSVDFVPVLTKSVVDDLVARTQDSIDFMKTFMSGPTKQCSEILLYVTGPANMISIPDISNSSRVPSRVSTRTASLSSRTFVSSGQIEVSKSFECDGFSNTILTKHFCAKVHAFVIRGVLPCSMTGKGDEQTFRAASLSCIHVGATGTGMSVLSSPQTSSFCSSFRKLFTTPPPKLTVAGPALVWEGAWGSRRILECVT